MFLDSEETLVITVETRAEEQIEYFDDYDFFLVNGKFYHCDSDEIRNFLNQSFICFKVNFLNQLSDTLYKHRLSDGSSHHELLTGFKELFNLTNGIFEVIIEYSYNRQFDNEIFQLKSIRALEWGREKLYEPVS